MLTNCWKVLSFNSMTMLSAFSGTKWGPEAVSDGSRVIHIGITLHIYISNFRAIVIGFSSTFLQQMKR